MKRLLSRPLLGMCLGTAALAAGMAWGFRPTSLEASSHREAPMIADDPMADNTDVYAFKDPNNADRIILIANYIPFQLPQGGPNYYTFGENVRYEIHVKNKSTTPGDDITYRFTFSRTNGDASTFFNIRLGQENLKTTYTCQKSTDGGQTFADIVTNGVVPPYNIGPRSINGAAGLNQSMSYTDLRQSKVTTASGGGGEQVFCGSSEDPFFVDLGATFDLAGFRINKGARDGVGKYNVHSIALSVPVATLQKTGLGLPANDGILDPDYVIGVWASASRPTMRTLSTTGGATGVNATYVQVSRLGMPLTNEVINPIMSKDAWNRTTPYAEAAITDAYLSDPELGLYMDDRQFGTVVPAMAALRIQTKSLAGQPGLGGASFPGFDFGNTKDGLFILKGNSALNGTALADDAFGNYLLRDNQPRSVDILPIFHTGVPNLRPYQLATGKGGNPLAAGKPFVHNFLTLPGSNPGGDMLRLNMAVPATPRNSPDFSNQGLLAAAVLGLTDARYNTNTNVEFIPNMDGFPNGRRLEDDVVKIELQAVGGAALAAIGLWYDDYTPTSPSPVTPKLKGVLNFATGVEKNDTTFRAAFPFVQTPWQGFAVRR